MPRAGRAVRARRARRDAGAGRRGAGGARGRGGGGVHRGAGAVRGVSARDARARRGGRKVTEMDVRPRIPVDDLGADAGFRGGVLRLQPDLLDAFLRYYGNLWSHGVLDHAVKEAARIRNARLVDCRWCRNVRFSVAREEGLTEDLVEQIDDDVRVQRARRPHEGGAGLRRRVHPRPRRCRAGRARPAAAAPRRRPGRGADDDRGRVHGLRQAAHGAGPGARRHADASRRDPEVPA